ncbi:hypothetical protein OUZ56_016201 [Daphnia magna]|uniref:Uncharacterized protein n=1 Tax=Daphnia magna TaxID=35525 RepID=A0ABR0APX8_9CRUS|nr:hypothetical protein OUZ56_016201 [Daphnia magna]
MVANSFLISIPGWMGDESGDLEVTGPAFEAQNLQASTSMDSISATDYESEMVEVEIYDPMWRILEEIGVDLTDISFEDYDVSGGFEDVPASLELLRSNCVAHTLQPVIKDGLKALKGNGDKVVERIS